MTTTQASLKSLRLPELQARYAEVIGETTRSPNKKYLIRRITEALASRPAARDDAPARKSVPARAGQPGKRKSKQGKPGISTKPEETSPSTDAAPAAMGGAAESSGQPAETGKPLRELTITELQQRYLDVVGRPTGSSHRGYLIWKIREAQKGRIPVGPRTRRSPNEPAPDHKILPLRMDAELVERLDDARARLGLPSRMELFRKALSAYLAAEGEHDLAEALVPGA